MKLKTKIIFMNSIAILFAILLSDVVIWNVCRESLVRETVQTSYLESYKIFDEFHTFIKTVGKDADETDIRYFFTNRNDDYTVCVKKIWG